jgi:nucleotidyltransferase/DNA polymerase involved in DNA repair
MEKVIDGESSLTYIKNTLTTTNMNLTINPIRSLNAYSPINMLPGIGRHTPQALRLYGINTIYQFSLFTDTEVRTLLGSSGLKLLRKAKNLARYK